MCILFFYYICIAYIFSLNIHTYIYIYIHTELLLMKLLLFLFVLNVHLFVKNVHISIYCISVHEWKPNLQYDFYDFFHLHLFNRLFVQTIQLHKIIAHLSSIRRKIWGIIYVCNSNIRASYMPNLETSG